MNESIDFKQLKLGQVINESASTKSITFQAKYKGQNAIIRLDKTPFEEDSAKEALDHNDLVSERNLANDIYSRYKIISPGSDINSIKATIVIPASEAVLAKYSRSETIFFSETSDVYLKVVEPFIENLLANEKDHNQWVYNILEGKFEADSVIMNDPDKDSGFMLLPSLKSSGDEKELHVLAICHRRDIRSLRDLDDKHIPLLKNILVNGTNAIKNKYCNQSGQLRSYIHYHPTFYHFHVHFEMVDPSEYKASDRDNLLETVISNISLMKDYYRKITLVYPLSQASALYQELKLNNCS